MAINYSLDCINNRLQAVVDTIDDGDSNGFFLVREGSTTLATIELARPCGTVAGGVLTFSGTLLDDSADAAGDADNCIIQDSAGTAVVTGLTVGIPFSGANVIISNGLNSTAIAAGETVALQSAQITGS